MSTLNQIIKIKRKVKIKNNIKKTALEKCPQRKGSCVQVYIRTPKNHLLSITFGIANTQ